jgi:S-(hydroxymethyl)glutathione dehydrogenase/alcohol dehydrogenase
VRAAISVPGTGTVQIEDVTPAPVGPHDVLVRVDASGVCHTDLSAALGRSAGYERPKVLGHEGAGTVLEIGDRVRRCEVGDRVIASFVPACGDCWFCSRGWTNHCERTAERVSAYSVTRPDGSLAQTMAGLGTFAEVMTVHEDALVPVRTDLPSEQLALIGCGVTTGVGAVLWTAGVEPGASVAVYGVGGVGHFVLQGARIAGAAEIIVVDPLEHKRAHATSLGATHAIDPADGDPVQAIAELTGGRGADYVFEVVGKAEVAEQAYASARRRGTVVLIGKPAAGTVLNLPGDVLFRHEKRLVGSLYGSARIREHFPTLVLLAEQGILDIGAAISRRFALEDANDALAAIEDGTVIRSVLC